MSINITNVFLGEDLMSDELLSLVSFSSCTSCGCVFVVIAKTHEQLNVS